MTPPRNAAARLFYLSLMALGVAACSITPPSNVKSNAQLTPTSRITHDLAHLPRPKRRLAVAVYGFRDQTGQYKPSPDSSYSTSVTQGAAAMLVKALKDSGWYVPVEREGLQNLLTERKIVRAIESPTDKGKPLVNLPNLLPASLIIEGGVIAYESNVRTGGKGANYLGVGANTQYRVDQVTVSLRGVDIRTGQVLDTVSVTKTIYSFQFSASLYKFSSYQHLLQGETGYTTNEPAQLAVREAIEAAVIHMTLLGVRDRYLELNDPRDFYLPLVQTYLKENLRGLAEDAGIDEDEPVLLRSLTGDAPSPPAPMVPTASEHVVIASAAPAALVKPVATATTTVAATPVAPLSATAVVASAPAAASQVKPVVTTASPAASPVKAVARAAPSPANPVKAEASAAPPASSAVTAVAAPAPSTAGSVPPAPATNGAVAAAKATVDAVKPPAPAANGAARMATVAAPVPPASPAAQANAVDAAKPSGVPSAGSRAAPVKSVGAASDDIFKQYWNSQGASQPGAGRE